MLLTQFIKILQRAMSGIRFSESVKVLLDSDFLIAFVLVIPALSVHIIDHPDGDQIEVTQRQPQLYAAEQEQRRGHFPVSWAKFF